MKKKRSSGKPLLVCCSPGSALCAQSPGDLNEGSQLEWDDANAIHRFTWGGVR